MTQERKKEIIIVIEKHKLNPREILEELVNKKIVETKDLTLKVNPDFEVEITEK